MIRRVEPTTPAAKVIEQNDVLLSFDGVPIANDGTVPFRSGELLVDPVVRGRAPISRGRAPILGYSV